MTTCPTAVATDLVVGQPIGTPFYLDTFDHLLDSGMASPSDEPGRWRLVRGHYGARHGQVLHGAAAQQPPTLSFAGPPAPGRYALFVGLFSPADRQLGLYLRIDGQPQFHYVQCQRHEPSLERIYVATVDLRAHHAIEVACFGRDAGLDYLEFVPVRGGGVDAARAGGRGKLIGILDFADDAGVSRPVGQEAASAVRRHHDIGYDIVMWKAYAVRCEYHTRIGVMRQERAPDVDGPRDGLASSNAGIGQLLQRYDTMRQAVDEAQRQGLDLFGWMRISNEFSRPNHQFSPDTPFHQAHRDKVQIRRDGQPSTKLSFAYPEVCRHKLELFREIAAYGMNGMFIDVLRHPPMMQFDQPVVDAFMQQTGQDPRQMEGDGSEAWLRFRARVFTQFLSDCRAALDALSPQRRLPLYVRTVDQPWYNLVIGCDVDDWLDRGVVDGIVFGPWCATAPNYPDRLDLGGYIRRAAGRTKIFGQVWRYGSALHAQAMADDLYQQGADGVALYESNATVACDWFRRNLWRLKG